MMSNLERLVYMANQIARNFEAQGHDCAVAATADHIAHFWDPRMREQIFACMEAGGQGLGETAAAALQRLHDQRPPPPQTHATRFNKVGEGAGSDAG